MSAIVETGEIYQTFAAIEACRGVRQMALFVDARINE